MKRPAALLSVFLALASAQTAAAEVVADTVFSRGGAMVSREGEIALLGIGSPIFEKDVITTGRDSLAVVHFRDGTKVTIRPDSVFEVQEYAHGNGKESLFGRLFKGGLRAISGLISRNNPDGFQVATTVATIGIRGTDFTARLCADECAAEAQALAAQGGAAAVRSAVVGRIAVQQGSMTAVGAAGDRRSLAVGSPVHEGDRLLTERGAFAVIAFRDESRISLRGDSEFIIERHRLDLVEPANSGSFFRLLKGAMRAVSGLIAQTGPDAVQVATPIATIGIRGTSYDLVCSGDCAASASADAAGDGRSAGNRLATRLAQSGGAAGGGLFVVVRSGTLFTSIGGQPVDIPAGATVFFGAAGPRFDLPLPPSLAQGLPPIPETVTIDPALLSVEPRAPQPGLWVSVNDEGGHVQVRLAGQTLDVGQGEAALAGTGELVRVEVPGFVSADPWNVNPSAVNEAALPGAGLPDMCN